MKKASIICLTILLLVSSLFAAVPASAGALLKDREDFEWGIGGHNSAYPAYPERTYKEQVRLAAQMGCDIYRLNYNPTNMSMLNYLDIYPLTLPARYTDRTACYTKVYITSNIPLEEQYRDIQRAQMETWRAFLRRITNVVEYLPDGTTIKHKKGDLPYD